MTFGEMQDRTRVRLNEATAVFYSDDDIALALNEGYAEMADVTEFYERHAYIPMLRLRTYYDLSLILPDTFLSPRRVYNPITGAWLTPTDAAELDGRYAQWELVQGEPDQYLMRGNWWFGVFPKPTRDSVGLRFYYTSIPPVMEDDADTPEFPREFSEGLIEYALADLMGQQRDAKKALFHWQKYLNFQDRLKTYVNSRQQIPAVTVIG